MSEKTERVGERARELMITYKDDPAEFTRQFEEMLREEYGEGNRQQATGNSSEPLKEREFEDGEDMPMYEFLARFQKFYCRGVMPAFYSHPIRVIVERHGCVEIIILPRARDSVPPVVSEWKGDSPQRFAPFDRLTALSKVEGQEGGQSPRATSMSHEHDL